MSDTYGRPRAAAGGMAAGRGFFSSTGKLYGEITEKRKIETKKLKIKDMNMENGLTDRKKCAIFSILKDLPIYQKSKIPKSQNIKREAEAVNKNFY